MRILLGHWKLSVIEPGVRFKEVSVPRGSTLRGKHVRLLVSLERNDVSKAPSLSSVFYL